MSKFKCEVISQSIPPGNSAELRIETDEGTFMLPIGFIGAINNREAREARILLIPKPAYGPLDWCKLVMELDFGRVLEFLTPQNDEKTLSAPD